MWGSIINSLLAGHIHMLSRVVDRKKKTWKAYLERRRFRGWTEPENIIRNSKLSAFSSRVSCWDSYKFMSINVDLNWKGCLPNLVEGSRRWLLTSVGMFASPPLPYPQNTFLVKQFSLDFTGLRWMNANEKHVVKKPVAVTKLKCSSEKRGRQRKQLFKHRWRKVSKCYANRFGILCFYFIIKSDAWERQTFAR